MIIIHYTLEEMCVTNHAIADKKCVFFSFVQIEVVKTSERLSLKPISSGMRRLCFLSNAPCETFAFHLFYFLCYCLCLFLLNLHNLLSFTFYLISIAFYVFIYPFTVDDWDIKRKKLQNFP